MPQRRLETAFLLDFEALWRVFLDTFAILPVFAAPMPSRQLAGWLGITLMPSSEAPAPIWIALLNRHLGIAIADGLAFTALAGSHNELFSPSRCPARAVTG